MMTKKTKTKKYDDFLVRTIQGMKHQKKKRLTTAVVKKQEFILYLDCNKIFS